MHKCIAHTIALPLKHVLKPPTTASAAGGAESDDDDEEEEEEGEGAEEGEEEDAGAAMPPRPALLIAKLIFKLGKLAARNKISKGGAALLRMQLHGGVRSPLSLVSSALTRFSNRIDMLGRASAAD